MATSVRHKDFTFKLAVDEDGDKFLPLPVASDSCYMPDWCNVAGPPSHLGTL